MGAFHSFKRVTATLLLLLGPLGSVLSTDRETGCLLEGERPHCEKGRGQRLVCTGGVVAQDQNWSISKVRALSICGWPEPSFDPGAVLSSFPSLQKFTLSFGNVTHLTGDFLEQTPQLQMINMSHLRLERLEASTFSKLEALRVVDLRGNMLTTLEAEVFGVVPRLEKLYLAGNPWHCGPELIWLPNTKALVDRDRLECASPYPDKPLVPVLSLLRSFLSECPADCTCFMYNVVWGGTTLVPVTRVDCQRQGLTELPARLPANTTALLLQGNKISNLKLLASSEQYRAVQDIYLDGNRVKSITALEGSAWLLQFRVLSLRHNLLTQLPTYALDNALERNHNVVNIFLGGNPWKCDCLFVPGFQDLLVKYMTLVKDVDEVRCAGVEGDENSMQQITQLSRTSVCRLPSEHFIRPLDLLNGVLASLIVLVVGKLAYDFWSFKRTGKLPWIVAKMP